MGGEKQTGTTVVNQTTSATPTAEETARNKLQLEQEQAADPFVRALQKSGLELGNLLLRGEGLPGYLGALPGGISPDVVNNITNQSLKDLNVQLAQSGAGSFLESGASQAIGSRTSGDIRNQAAQFNSQNLAQLLNIATGQGQANPLGYSTDLSNSLSGRLAGLRSFNTQGTTTQTQIGMNPFLRSFQNSAGSSLGKGLFFG